MSQQWSHSSHFRILFVISYSTAALIVLLYMFDKSALFAVSSHWVFFSSFCVMSRILSVTRDYPIRISSNFHRVFWNKVPQPTQSKLPVNENQWTLNKAAHLSKEFSDSLRHLLHIRKVVFLQMNTILHELSRFHRFTLGDSDSKITYVSVGNIVEK